jgi:hypothetical protein
MFQLLRRLSQTTSAVPADKAATQQAVVPAEHPLPSFSYLSFAAAENTDCEPCFPISQETLPQSLSIESQLSRILPGVVGLPPQSTAVATTSG